MSGDPKAYQRLATYGTLAPGRRNYHQVAMIGGTWSLGVVRGHLRQLGWGAEEGYPGLIPDPTGPIVEVHVLEAPDLPQHWERLDAFEGAEYRRVILDVTIDNEKVPACIYALADID